MEKNSFFPILFSVVLFSACTKIQEPEFRRIDNFKIKGVNLQQATIGFHVTYYNPNDFSMAVKETEAMVNLDGVDVGKFVQDTTVTVAAKSEFSIPISGAVPFSKALQLNITNLSGNREIHIKATGTTKVGKAGIFITKPYTYDGKHKMSDMNM